MFNDHSLDAIAFWAIIVNLGLLIIFFIYDSYKFIKLKTCKSD